MDTPRQPVKSRHDPTPHPCVLCGYVIGDPGDLCPLCADEMALEHQARVRAEREAKVAWLIEQAERAAGMDDGEWGYR